MDYGHLIATGFGMDERTWERHASPWSVWTRVPLIVPLLASIWSHSTLGWWALVPITAVLGWTWLNPRVFSPPPSTRNWASKATFGERVWLRRRHVPIPRHHEHAAHLLSAVAAASFVAAVYGAVRNDLALTVGGGAISLLSKLWFCDRMVWLFEDMKDAQPDYRAWLRP